MTGRRVPERRTPKRFKGRVLITARAIVLPPIEIEARGDPHFRELR